MCSQSRRTRAATTIQLWWRAELRKKHDIPLDVWVQAVRTRRSGLLIRNATQSKDFPDGRPPVPRKGSSRGSDRSSADGSAEFAKSNSGGILRKVGFFGGDPGEPSSVGSKTKAIAAGEGMGTTAASYAAAFANMLSKAPSVGPTTPHSPGNSTRAGSLWGKALSGGRPGGSGGSKEKTFQELLEDADEE